MKPVTAQQFRDGRVFAGLTRPAAAELLGVSLRTIGHWETGKARPPWAAFKLLRVLRHGEFVDPRWSGYRVVLGKLVTPENHTLEPHDLAWLTLLVRRAAAFSELLAWRDGRDGAGTRPSAATTAATAPGCALDDRVSLSIPGRVHAPAPVEAIVSRVERPTPERSKQSPPPCRGSIQTIKHLDLRVGRSVAVDCTHGRNKRPPCSNTGMILKRSSAAQNRRVGGAS